MLKIRFDIESDTAAEAAAFLRLLVTEHASGANVAAKLPTASPLPTPRLAIVPPTPGDDEDEDDGDDGEPQGLAPLDVLPPRAPDENWPEELLANAYLHGEILRVYLHTGKTPIKKLFKHLEVGPWTQVQIRDARTLLVATGLMSTRGTKSPHTVTALGRAFLNDPHVHVLAAKQTPEVYVDNPLSGPWLSEADIAAAQAPVQPAQTAPVAPEAPVVAEPVATPQAPAPAAQEPVQTAPAAPEAPKVAEPVATPQTPAGAAPSYPTVTEVREAVRDLMHEAGIRGPEAKAQIAKAGRELVAQFGVNNPIELPEERRQEFLDGIRDLRAAI